MNNRWNVAGVMRVGALCLIWMGLATAGLASADLAPKVIYLGEGASATAAADTATVMSLLSPAIALVDPPVHVTEWTQGDKLRVMGSQQATPCNGPALDGQAYRDKLDELYRASTELGETRVKVQSIKATQACLSEPVATHDLARPAYLMGVVEFSDDNEDAARQAFSEVLAIDPAFKWDPEYPPAAELFFGKVAAEVAEGGQSVVRVAASEASTVMIDGQPLGTPLDGVQLTPGRHLIQVLRPGHDQFESLVVAVPAGEESLVVDPSSLAEAEGQPHEALAKMFELLFAALHDSSAGTPEFVVALTPQISVWAWDDDGKTLEARTVPVTTIGDLHVEVAEVKPTVKPSTPTFPVMIAAGGAALVAGAILGGVSAGQAGAMRNDIESGELPYAHPDDPNPTSEQSTNATKYKGLQAAGGVGGGLIAAGAVVIAIAIPMKFLGGSSNQELAFSASLLTPPGMTGEDVGVNGFQFSIGIR